MRVFDMLAMFSQPSGTEQDPRGAMLNMVVTIGILGVMFYFLLIRPQSKQRKEQEALIKNVKTGDKVLMNNGIFGIVTNVKVEVLKSAIGSVVQKSAEVEAAASAQK